MDLRQHVQGYVGPALAPTVDAAIAVVSSALAEALARPDAEAFLAALPHDVRSKVEPVMHLRPVRFDTVVERIMSAVGGDAGAARELTLAVCRGIGETLDAGVLDRIKPRLDPSLAGVLSSPSYSHSPHAVSSSRP